MSLEELDTLARGIGRSRICVVAEILPRLSKDDRETVEVALALPKYSDGVLSAFLRARGHHVTFQRVGAHRKGQCACQSR